MKYFTRASSSNPDVAGGVDKDSGVAAGDKGEFVIGTGANACIYIRLIGNQGGVGTGSGLVHEAE